MSQSLQEVPRVPHRNQLFSRKVDCQDGIWTFMKLWEKLRRWQLNGFLHSRAKPPLLPLASTAKHESKPSFYFFNTSVWTRVSHKKMMSTWYDRTRSQRIGIALGFPEPWQFQPMMLIIPREPDCQGLPLKNEQGMVHCRWILALAH